MNKLNSVSIYKQSSKSVQENGKRIKTGLCRMNRCNWRNTPSEADGELGIVNMMNAVAPIDAIITACSALRSKNTTNTTTVAKKL